MGIKSISSAFDISCNTVRRYVRMYQDSRIPAEKLPLLSDARLQELFAIPWAREHLMEIIEDRHGHKSIIITSQLPVADWCDAIRKPTVADAILDRMVHTAHRIEQTGESVRKIKANKRK